jgi:hypothetical protein
VTDSKDYQKTAEGMVGTPTCLAPRPDADKATLFTHAFFYTCYAISRKMYKYFMRITDFFWVMLTFLFGV